MSVSVSTTAGNQVTVTVDGATQLSFTTQDSSISVVNGDTSSISVTNQGPKGDTGATGAKGDTGPQGPAGSDGTSPNAFTTISVAGQDNVVADGVDDTLTIAGGSNVTVTTNASSDTITIASTDTNTQLSTEEVQDIVGAMFTGNTETRIAATYEDSDGTIDLVVDDMTGTEVANDSSPQLGGDLDVNGNKIVSASNGDIVIDPNGTGAIIFKSDDIQFDGDGFAAGKIRLYESDILGSNYIALSAPLGVTNDTTLILPDGAGSNGQVLTTNGTGILSWATPLSSTQPDFRGIVDFKSAGVEQGQLNVFNLDESKYIALKAPTSIGTSVIFVLPAADGSAGQVLKTDGSGNLSFVNQTADTDTNLGNSDQTLSAERTIDLSGNALVIDNNSTEVARIFSNGYIQATGRSIILGTGTVGGEVRMYDADSTNYVGIKSPAVVSSDLSFTLPDSDGSAGQVLKTDGSGNLSFTDQSGGSSSTLTQVFNMNFFDDLSNLKHYIPWKDVNEQSQNYQDESAFLMPYDGRIVSVSLKITSVTGSGDITLGIESIPTGSSPFVFPGSWTIEETETLSATSTSDHHTFHFVFSNASHFEAGDTVALTIQNSADITGTSYIHATAIVEWDTSANLGSSSTEHTSNP